MITKDLLENFLKGEPVLGKFHSVVDFEIYGDEIEMISIEYLVDRKEEDLATFRSSMPLDRINKFISEYREDRLSKLLDELLDDEED